MQRIINSEYLFKELIKANYHDGGIKCLRLFKVNNHFFDSLIREINILLEQENPSNVRDKKHISNEVTKPSGSCLHFHLLNSSGRFDDPSDDYNRSVFGKKFHHPTKYPNLGAFIQTFPHAMNMKLLVLGENSDLHPHESDIILNSHSPHSLQVRFHLPIVTNKQAEMLLDNEFYYFEAGSIFFFNHGCIHSALNHGHKARVHLSWDMLLTRDTFDLMFAQTSQELPDFLEKISGDEKIVNCHRIQIIKEYEIQGKGKELYDKLKLKSLGIKPYLFQNCFNKFSYWHKKGKTINFSEVQ
jgi:hypothetical protein